MVDPSCSRLVADLGFGLVVRFSLRPGGDGAFNRLVAETVSLIEEREPGTLVYLVHQIEDDPEGRVFYELYRDHAAFDEHNAQEHVRRFLAEHEQYLIAPPRVEFLNLRSDAGPLATRLDSAAVAESSLGDRVAFLRHRRGARSSFARGTRRDETPARTARSRLTSEKTRQIRSWTSLEIGKPFH